MVPFGGVNVVYEVDFYAPWYSRRKKRRERGSQEKSFC